MTERPYLTEQKTSTTQTPDFFKAPKTGPLDIFSHKPPIQIKNNKYKYLFLGLLALVCVDKFSPYLNLTTNPDLTKINTPQTTDFSFKGNGHYEFLKEMPNLPQMKIAEAPFCGINEVVAQSAFNKAKVYDDLGRPTCRDARFDFIAGGDEITSYCIDIPKRSPVAIFINNTTSEALILQKMSLPENGWALLDSYSAREALTLISIKYAKVGPAM